MNTTIVLSIDTRRPKIDGTCPVILRLTHFRRTVEIRTGIYIKEKDWDSKNRKIKSSYRGTESVSRLQNKLEKQKAEATDYIHKLDEQKKLNSLTAYELKGLIEKKPQKHSFITYTEDLIKEMMEANHIGNARTYETTLKSVKKFMDGKDLSFLQLSSAWLKKFENNFLKKPGNTVNGLAVYLRTIRAIYNQAIKAKIVDRDLYPFADYTIQKEKTRKRAIPFEYIRRLQLIWIPEVHRHFNARNYFLVSFMLRGMNFTDLALLKVENIADGRIRYNRQKTGAGFDIKIPAELKEILDYYMQGKERDEYLFPIVTAVTPEHIYDQISWARKRFNKRLKELAQECSIETNLTSYVSRHSFATRAKNLGIPITGISELLGHGDVKTTQIYLDTLPSDALDEMHDKVIKQ